MSSGSSDYGTLVQTLACHQGFESSNPEYVLLTFRIHERFRKLKISLAKRCRITLRENLHEREFATMCEG